MKVKATHRRIDKARDRENSYILITTGDSVLTPTSLLHIFLLDYQRRTVMTLTKVCLYASSRLYVPT